jgi:hypothetical protein
MYCMIDCLASVAESIEKKESYRWLESLRNTHAIMGDTRVVTVCDREGDIYPQTCRYRPLQWRNVRSVTPSISAASAIVTSRRCRRSYSSSNRICLTSWSTFVRLIMGPP